MPFLSIKFVILSFFVAKVPCSTHIHGKTDRHSKDEVYLDRLAYPGPPEISTVTGDSVSDSLNNRQISIGRHQII